VAPPVADLLGLAVDLVRQDGAGFRRDAVSPEEVASQLRVLRSALLGALGGEDPSGDLPRSPLARQLLTLLRRGTHHLLAEQPPLPAAELMGLFGAFEAVGERLEPRWDQVFSDRLSGPDGLALVVEVAHDLRSPLTSILFLAETLQKARSGTVTPLQERQLGLIYSAAFGLSSVASDVIELARGGDRLVDLDPLPFSVSDILESVRDIVLPIAEEKGLAIRLVTTGCPARVGYPVALSRVLLNLTTNALKFTDEGSVEVTAREVAADQVEFAVRDTGRGIPPGAMAMLFEPFRRRPGEADYAFSGSGLGLSICRRLVEAMGSSLHVETAPGKGTRFHFALPLPRAELVVPTPEMIGTTT
jgi:hypothetical protein